VSLHLADWEAEGAGRTTHPPKHTASQRLSVALATNNGDQYPWMPFRLRTSSRYHTANCARSRSWVVSCMYEAAGPQQPPSVLCTDSKMCIKRACRLNVTSQASNLRSDVFKCTAPSHRGPPSREHACTGAARHCPQAWGHACRMCVSGPQTATNRSRAGDLSRPTYASPPMGPSRMPCTAPPTCMSGSMVELCFAAEQSEWHTRSAGRSCREPGRHLARREAKAKLMQENGDEPHRPVDDEGPGTLNAV